MSFFGPIFWSVLFLNPQKLRDYRWMQIAAVIWETANFFIVFFCFIPDPSKRPSDAFIDQEDESALNEGT